MTELLERAFEEAAKLTPDEQDAFARWMLEELESERRWLAAFAASQDVLDQLADEAMAGLDRSKQTNRDSRAVQ